ncbi:hypothetical protein NC651_008173 [Populus alba x Populus x berolinensis]|nr:hypothetical protein NC651_008173 [Populus alba x Populus x berolinensis]
MDEESSLRIFTGPLNQYYFSGITLILTTVFPSNSFLWSHGHCSSTRLRFLLPKCLSAWRYDSMQQILFSKRGCRSKQVASYSSCLRPFVSFARTTKVIKPFKSIIRLWNFFVDKSPKSSLLLHEKYNLEAHDDCSYLPKRNFFKLEKSDLILKLAISQLDRKNLVDFVISEA